MGRINTIRIDYGALPNKPSLTKVQKFCSEKLGLKRGEVIRIQNSRVLNVTFVTVIDLNLANKLCEEHGHNHEMTGADKKQYPVTISMEDGTVLVKMYDLSTDVSNDAVAKFLEQYGDVHDVYEDQLGDDQEFAGAYTGIRIAKMVVKQNIPSWVTINGELTQLSFFGQRQTCRHCYDFLHVGVGCVQNKKLLVQKTYADAAKQPAKPQPSKTKLPPPPTVPKLLSADGKKKQLAGPSKPSKDKSTDEKPAGIPDKTAATVDKNCSQFLKPLPPAEPQECSQSQPLPAGGEEMINLAAESKSDGNETDSSTTSRRSKRNKNKRQKYNENQQEEEEEEL